ncbi:hypothetical protein TNCV_3794971 [Trichonephila clavipes]|nr:hypothetical protein TNCV_3794971 [Trichonephila clavipes]
MGPYSIPQRHRRSSSSFLPFHSNLGLRPSFFSALFKSVPTRASSHAFSIQGRAFSFSPSRAGLSLVSRKNPLKHQGWVHKTPLVPSYWQVTKVSLGLPSSYLRITHQYTWPKGAITPCPTSDSLVHHATCFYYPLLNNTRKDDMILLRQASPIVNGVPALLY